MRMRARHLLVLALIVPGACHLGTESPPATPITGPLTGATYLSGVGDINLDMLVVKGATSSEAATAAENLGGRLFSSPSDTQHYIKLPVESRDELQEAKATLEADGFDVEFMVVGRLLVEPGS